MLIEIKILFGDIYENDCFCCTNFEGKLEDWKNMILGNMLGENKKATDESREFAGVQERSYLQKMSKGHVCILTWEGNDPLSFWLDLMKIALPGSTWKGDI